jgi:thiol:disulfide interchange protein DsbA
MNRLITALIGLLLAFPLSAQQVKPPLEGIDYLTLNPPQPTDAGGKIEVTEFFWYRCPHCYNLEPVLEPWVKKLPRDTQFKRVPAIFNDEWALDARIFYALEAIGDGERVHRKLFETIHNDGGVRLKGDGYMKWVAAWLGKNGVDMAKYDAALRSFTVDTKLKRAMQLTQAYKIDGVPAVAVQGRWVASASMSGERQVMMAVTDYLIGEARKRAARQ